IIKIILKCAGTRSAVRGIEELLNLGGQALAPASAWTWGIAAFAPRVVAGPSDAQHAGHEHDREVGLLLLDELIHLDQACVFAKKAAAFFKNSFSSFSCRFDSSSSSIHARSFGESAVSGSGFWARYFVTQLPSVPSLISNSRATSAIARSDSITSCTASALNCLLNLRRLVDTITSFRLNVVYQNHDTPRNNTEPDSPYRLTSQKPAPGSGVEEDVPKDTRDVPFPIAYSARCIRRYSLGVIPTHC